MLEFKGQTEAERNLEVVTEIRKKNWYERYKIQGKKKGFGDYRNPPTKNRWRELRYIQILQVLGIYRKPKEVSKKKILT